jgi:hypothetical protein
MGSACACTTPTGAKGEALTFTRTGDATCSRSGLATTGIQNGDLVTCTANQPRVEPSGGVLGLRVERARTLSLLRFIDYTNALWADVGTPTPTTGQTSPWTGALSTSAVLYDDNDAAAQEGRSQTVTVTAAVAHTMHCYVKAGTLTSAAISLDGTVATLTGLVTTSWSIVEVTDASSSGVAISAQILNGSTAAGTGTVIWGGCAVEQGSYRTSIMPTVASAVTRNAETTSLTSAVLPLTGSVAVTTQRPYGSVLASNQTLVDALVSTSSGWRFSFVGSQLRIEKGGPLNNLGAATTWAAGDAPRWAASFDGVNATVFVNGAVLVGPSALGGFTAPTYTPVALGWDHQGFDSFDGIVTRVCVDPDPNRCR